MIKRIKTAASVALKDVKKTLAILFTVLYVASFMLIGLFAIPAKGETINGLNWYTKIDYSDTPSLTPNFNQADYFNCGISPNIDYYWGGGTSQCWMDNGVAWGYADPNQHDYYTNLWKGYITAPETGLVTFYSANDDGFIVKINGETVITSWGDQPSWYYNGQGTYQMTAGESYTIEVLHHETGGGSVAQFFWQLPNTTEVVVVPTSAFTTEPVIQEPDPFLNSPTNLSILQRKDYIELSWDAPVDSGTAVERYAIFWNVEGGNGWGIASTETSIRIDKDVLRSTASLDQDFTFTVRSDNDTLAVYSPQSEPITEYVEELPSYVCWDGSVVEDASQCPPEPSPTPSPTPTPTPSESPTEEPSPTPEPSPTEEPSPTPSPTDEPTEEPTPEPSPTDEPSPEPSPTDEPTEEPSPEPQPEEPVTTEELVDSVLEEYGDQPIPADELRKLGLDYGDLPPDQPVTLENGVVITAEVADAIEIFEDPAELISTVFTDPGKALTAVANIGADLPEEVREQAQKVTVAAVVVGQVVAGTATLTLARRM